jgi:hypothetical protein
MAPQRFMADEMYESTLVHPLPRAYVYFLFYLHTSMRYGTQTRRNTFTLLSEGFCSRL